mmetsp:Transcript_2540/g.3916  ORF Transcript_2540/g.3916 Transcript_2540/m.3916 type:complete len:255 (-) Transcript_2540:64-828(-)
MPFVRPSVHVSHVEYAQENADRHDLNPGDPPAVMREASIIRAGRTFGAGRASRRGLASLAVFLRAGIRLPPVGKECRHVQTLPQVRQVEHAGQLPPADVRKMPDSGILAAGGALERSRGRVRRGSPDILRISHNVYCEQAPTQPVVLEHGLPGDAGPPLRLELREEEPQQLQVAGRQQLRGLHGVEAAGHLPAEGVLLHLAPINEASLHSPSLVSPESCIVRLHVLVDKPNHVLLGIQVCKDITLGLLNLCQCI